ncbi:MAG: hypothetical protein JKY81_12245 [Colwellia sp.]|nr:hypothetical protein [Colwellia sp.]
MSFHEKSAWACLVSILLAYTPYFWMVFQHPMAAVGLFVLSAIILAVLLTAFHIVNALATRSIRKAGDMPAHDELDRIIELQASKLSGIVLAFVVVTWCITVIYGVLGISEVAHAETLGDPLTTSRLVVPVMDILSGVHALFAGFVIANLVYYGRIVAGYRKLARG